MLKHVGLPGSMDEIKFYHALKQSKIQTFYKYVLFILKDDKKLTRFKMKNTNVNKTLCVYGVVRLVKKIKVRRTQTVELPPS